MAVIQTIRDKYAKLAGGIIVVALIGFVLMDFGKGGGSRSTAVGEINGRKIDVSEYEALIKQREEELKRQNPNLNLDDNMQARLRDQVWNEIVGQELLNDINEKLGITVSASEMNDLLTGPNPDPQVRQAFTNPQTGVFNPQEVSAAIQQIKANPQMQAEWEQFENGIKKRRYVEKFTALVNGGIYVPQFVLDDQYAGRHTLASINYVRVPYTSVADDQVKVTDEDIKSYMQAHSAMFEVKEPSRGIRYVSFPVVASADDSAATLNALDQIRQEFATTTDVAGFVNRNSENPVPPNYYTAQQLQGLPDVNALTSASVGDVVGPFYDGSAFVLARIMEKSSFPDSVKCRHILVKTADGANTVLSDEQAKARIDSAIALLQSGVPFDSVVTRFSDDAGSLQTGGVYDFTLAQKPGISKEFGDFIFEGQKGQTKLVKVSNDAYSGYHYIEILDQSASTPVTKIAFVSKSLNPDKNTYNTIYNKATQFASKVGSGNDFDKVAQEQGLHPANADGLDANSFLINGLGSSRELVKWAYEAKPGDVSPIYTVGDQFVVAKLDNIQEKGLAKITEENRPILKNYVIREKKAKILLEKYKNPPASLDAVAAAEKQTVASVDSVAFQQPFVPGLGNEPKVIGYSFFKALKENTVSPAIPGAEGVYFISLLSRQKAAEAPRNINNERKMLEMALQRSALNGVMAAVREKAEVEDTRGEIY